MINQIYFADEDLISVEKAIYEMSLKEDLSELDSEHILERLFSKGFSFKGWNKAKIMRRIVKYLKKWAEFELQKLEKENLSTDLKANFRKEGLLLLQQYLRLSSRNLERAFNTAYDIAFKLIKERYIKKFINVLYLASFYPTLEDLEKARKAREYFERLSKERRNKCNSIFDTFSQNYDEQEELSEKNREGRRIRRGRKRN